MPRSDDFQLGLLPERHISWRTLASAYGVIVLVLLLSVSVGFLFPDELRFRQKYTVTEIVPRPDLQPKPMAQKKTAQQKLVAKLKPVIPALTAKLFVPKDLPRQKKKEEEKEPPKLEAKFNAPVLQPVSATLPARVVYTGSFGSSAPATISAPIQQVQTGGFGDPNGLKGQGKEGAHLTATQVGSFDMPSGPGVGNGTGGAKGVQGTIASAGFGNGIALGANTGVHGSVQTSGFGSQELAHVSPKTIQADPSATTSQVEILFKPHPVYTDEARALKLEGEVLLEVLFTAAGQLHVNRVVRGLGHGLDETAVAAANKMRFKPAMQNGSPVDSTAIVHVVFQMAY
jgi:TonB family protein